MQAWEERIYDREDARAEGRAQGLEEGRAQGLEEGRAEGRAQGRVEGRAQGRSTTLFNVISNMLKDHLPLKMIVQYSGGTVDEIKEIARKLDIPVVDEIGN